MIKREDIQEFENLGLLAKHAVDGFITGLHKSPYHGFSVEFAEHRMYNTEKAQSILIGNYMLVQTICL